ncbi:MAG: NAD-dependent epimerase/dehydratase family protein [Candidatus Limnocylindria bacterium]
MRILVTGAAGFVGSHLCQGLLAEGHDVRGIDSFVDYYPRSIKEQNLAELRGDPRFEFAEVDLRSDPLDEALDGVEAVINEAAMAGLMRSWTDLDGYVGCNVLGLQRLIDAARRAGVRRFIQASTSSVYGENAVGDEAQPLVPVSPYGISKLAAEHLVLAHVQAFGFPAAVLRYFSIYGPRQRPDMAFHIFIEALLDQQPIVIFGDGRQSRSNTYVSDCVRGTIDALEGAEVGGIYNIGGGQEITLCDALELIAAACGEEPVVSHAPPRPGDQRRTWADTSKAESAFGYRPLVLPGEGLRSQVEWQAQPRSGRDGR